MISPHNDVRLSCSYRYKKCELRQCLRCPSPSASPPKSQLLHHNFPLINLSQTSSLPLSEMAAKTLLTLFFLSLALATPLNRRWTCGGTPPAFSCEPKAGCKSEVAWGDCATSTGLMACNDPLPNATQPVSACQQAAFTACETQYC
ncbi:hypothetical protein K491DRAFT_156307 [Lophiostoma macrostomum CBS 122681]|uniref:Uncharacterized protein n=1 Tax=Lophiostoma macrostomum CBS 122681 TaxID=1314788 RepID=A0A6A6STW7_9PLEO|nr:hypothetical protein K491DRAFT_156307 [Lophiostoma macrostomum CBS 122681]